MAFDLSRTLMIDGYEFDFVLTSLWGGDNQYGVIMRQEHAALLTDPDYMEAFHEALRTAEDAHLVLNMYLFTYLGSVEPEVLWDVLVKAETQTRWPLEEHDRRLINKHKQRVKETLAHKEEQRLKAEAKAARDAKKARKIPGFVYLIQSPTGNYKIGRTKNPENRLKTFEVKLPFEIEYACLIPTDDMRRLERELHQQLADKRVNGEWFELSPDDVDYIKALAELGG